MRLRQLSALLVTLMLMALWSSQSAHARRVALVIGNSAYQHVAELKNPRNDARDIAKTLKSIGFDDVELKEDLDYRALRMALRQFVQSSQGAELTFVFYAGHSIEVNKKNYLVPVDAKLNTAVDVDFEAIALDQVRTAASSASKLKMVILDACRNNPFKMAGRSSTRSVGRGLAIVEANTNELIAYSAKEGTVAQDGETSRNSPFTTALLKNLKKPGIEVGVMFRVIRDDVLSATSNQQEPYTYASLGGEPMFLNGRPTVAAPSTAPRPAYQAPPPISKEIQEAAAAWAATKDTDSTAVLEAFRRRYPGTVYADMALAKSDELASQQRDKRQRDALQEKETLSRSSGDRHEESPRTEARACVTRGDIAYCVSSYLPTGGVNRYNYGPESLADGSNRTAWVEGRSGVGLGEWILIDWRSIRRLRGLSLKNGYPKSSRHYRINGRITRLKAKLSNGNSYAFGVQDSSRPQLLRFPQIQSARWVKLEISGALRGAKYADTAINEIRPLFD